MQIEQVKENPEVIDLIARAESIIYDSEQWDLNGGHETDDIYRLLMDDGTAFDFYYKDGSNKTIYWEFGRVYPWGTIGGTAVGCNGNGYWIEPYNEFIKVTYSGVGKLLIDVRHIQSNGVIPFDMSLFGNNPRTIE